MHRGVKTTAGLKKQCDYFTTKGISDQIFYSFKSLLYFTFLTFLIFHLLQVPLPFQDSIVDRVLDAGTKTIGLADADPTIVSLIVAVGRQFVSSFEAMQLSFDIDFAQWLGIGTVPSLKVCFDLFLVPADLAQIVHEDEDAAFLAVADALQ